MRDRFKFRIWDGAEMHYNDFVVTATGYVGKITEEFLGKCVFNQEDLTADKESILMQCTGLKDKNGKLIYEGDIVNIIYIRPDGLEIRKKCKIEFGYYSFWLYYKCGASLLYKEDCTYEIIGNIYENSDLLEVENDNK